MPDVLTERIAGWRDRGASVLYVVREGAVIGALSLEDEVRPESRAAIDALHAGGVRVAMITGDARSVAEAVGADLGIDEVFAEVLPADKDSAVAELQRRGHTVAMVGDGVNDAPALARADVGIAIGAGTDVAIESAGIVLAASDPRAVVSIRRLSRHTYRKMLQNLWWAAGYNIIAIPLAAGALAWAGIVLPMAVGAVLMSLSTVVVALNAQLLRRTDLTAAHDRRRDDDSHPAASHAPGPRSLPRRHADAERGAAADRGNDPGLPAAPDPPHLRLLNDVHALGITGTGEAAAGLPASFVLHRSDIPKDPDRQPRPRSMPDTVLKVIAENLGVFEERCGVPERRITELLIYTGRRPDEICVLPWDCLERDPSAQARAAAGPGRRAPPGRPSPASAWGSAAAAPRPRGAAPAARRPLTPTSAQAAPATRSCGSSPPPCASDSPASSDSLPSSRRSSARVAPHSNPSCHSHQAGLSAPVAVTRLHIYE